MFTWITKQAVRSSDGYEVRFLGRFTAQYREGLRIRTIPVESGILAGKPAVLFSRHVFENWDNSSVANPPDEQDRLLRNFVEALRFQGLEADY
jgi:hypothetical protein